MKYNEEAASMVLTDLPNELLLSIAESCSRDRDIDALARTCHGLYSVLNPCLYRHNVQHSSSSALLWAVTWGKPRTAHLALDAGADVGDRDDMPLLHHMVRSSRCNNTEREAMRGTPEEYDAVIRLLLEKGIDINKRIWEGPVIASAVKAGDNRIFFPLIKNGADIKVVNNRGMTLLHLASLGGCSNEVLEYLIKAGLSVHDLDNVRNTPLHLAAHSGEVDAIRCLVLNGADVNARDDTGSTPAHRLMEIAADCCPNSVVIPTLKALLENGADINAQGKLGRRLLNLAINARRGEDVIRFLLNNGADVNAQGGLTGRTPLHEACVECSVPLAKLFLEHGANIHAKIKRGITPLHIAARRMDYGGPELVRFLLDNGAESDLVVEDSMRDTPCDIIWNSGYGEQFPDAVEIAVQERAKRYSSQGH